MYHTRSTLGAPKPTAKPSIQHGSAIPYASYISAPESVSADFLPPMVPSYSGSFDESSTVSSSSMSGGLGSLFGRNRSTEGGKENSKARAHDLSNLLELSSSRDETLNRKGSFPRNVSKKAPSMSGGGARMNLKQAMDFADKNQKENMAKPQNNTLLSEHEIKEQQRKAYDQLIKKSTGGKSYDVPNFC